MRKLVIIPAYNEAGNIEKVLNQFLRLEDYDIVVVNDCSTDDTIKRCREWADVKILDLPFNLGIGGAVQTGYRYAWENGYDIAIQVDGDGQHNPDFLDLLTAPIENEDYDMVIGSRFLKYQGFQSTALRRVGIKFFCKLIYLLSGKTLTDPTSGFRACNRKIICNFRTDYPRDYPEPETDARVLLQRLKVKEIPVIMNERQEGVSSISYTKSVYYMIKVTLAILIGALRGSYKKEVILNDT